MGWRCRDHVHLLSHDPHQLVRDWDDDDDGDGVDDDNDADVDDDDGSHDVVANGVHDHLHSYDSHQLVRDWDEDDDGGGADGVHPNSHKHFIPYMGFCASIWDSVRHHCHHHHHHHDHQK